MCVAFVLVECLPYSSSKFVVFDQKRTLTFDLAVVDWGHGLNGNNTWAQGSILFDLSGYKDDYEHAGAILTPLYLQLAWESSAGSTRDLRSGSTYSSLFVLNENGSELSDSLTKELTDANGQDSGEWTPYKTECYDPGCPTDSGASTTSSEVAAQPTSTGAASSAAATTSTASSTPESGSSGLNTGAIAGIAVACAIVGLALLGAAVWFLCFRRRRNSHGALHQNNGYASDGMGPGVMADKELPHVTDSPHSAYAPDRSLHAPHNLARNSVGGAGAAAGVGVGTGLMEGAGHVTHAGEDSYAPYSDHTPPPGVVGADRGPASSQTSLPAGGTNSPTPISNRYAHLVEEGMTDDEIRRLEEEERALDMAIEDHGRSSRAQ